MYARASSAIAAQWWWTMGWLVLAAAFALYTRIEIAGRARDRRSPDAAHL